MFSSSRWLIRPLVSSTIIFAASTTSLLHNNSRLTACEVDDDTQTDTPSSQSSKGQYYPYVILGGGTTAYSAIEAIRQLSPQSPILVLSSERVVPSLHRGDLYRNNETTDRGLGDDLLSSYNEWRRHITSKLSSEPDALQNSKIHLLLRQDQLKISPHDKVVELSNGGKVNFGKLLVATAGHPKSFYVLGDEHMKANKAGLLSGGGVNSLISLSDFEELERVIPDLTGMTQTNGGEGGLDAEDGSKEKTIVIIGGGFLGTEVALAMASRARAFNADRSSGQPRIKILQVYAEKSPLASYLPRYLSQDVKERLERHGVECIEERLVTDLHESASNQIRMNIVGEERTTLNAHYVIMASSTISPDVRIARESGLEIDTVNGGIVVNDSFEYGNGVYAAGVVASYYDHELGRRRVNRYDHSVNSGLLAGYNMVSSSGDGGDGTQRPYTHQPAVRSFLGDINVNCESIGECNSDLETVGVWINRGLDPGAPEILKNVSCKSPYKRGVIYYMRNSRVVGVVLWNADDLLEKARDLIRVNPMIRNDQLKRAIPLAPDDWLMVKKEHGRREGRKMVTEDDRESLVQVRSKEVGDGRGDH
ncbi:hypothetical protein TrST_g4166 [Triparma strigata]|uniref:FAD/NAD(P)-binding domain-containing protein n=1 Tax=Triparma strigata TaxID=1606541 RepID=A0A9W7BV06_9STRA|nr:hypothetical protein TrST_g4166 [Triparma strigata]